MDGRDEAAAITDVMRRRVLYDEHKLVTDDGRGAAQKRGTWQKKEDDKLVDLVQKMGARNWNEVSAAIPGRSSKSCRLRWWNQLNPAISKVVRVFPATIPSLAAPGLLIIRRRDPALSSQLSRAGTYWYRLQC